MARGTTPPRSSEALLAAYRRTGDPEAIGALFDALAPALYRVALALARDADQAEDVLQETFLAALDAVERFDPGRPVKPWLTGILRNMAARARRDEVRRPDPQRLREAAPGSAPVPDAEARERLRAAIDDLDEPYRAVALLHLVHGLPPGEIAHLRAEPPGTVRSTLLRARRRLAGVLAGTAGLSLLLAAGGGLASIRQAVVAHAAGRAATLTTLTVGGALMAKKTLAATLAACLLLLGGGALWWGSRDGDEAGERDATSLPVDADTVATLAPRDGPDPTARTPSQPRPGHVVGRVLDAEGRPIAGARLVAVSEAERFPLDPDGVDRAAATDEDGTFDLQVGDEAPAWCVLVEAPGHAPTVRRGLRGGRRMDVALGPPARMTGRVTDLGGKPLPGARVSVLAVMDTVQVVRTGVADAEGRYVVEDLMPVQDPQAEGPAVLAWTRAEADGHAAHTALLSMEAPLRLAVIRDFELSRGGTLHVRVLDGESGAALPGARVELVESTHRMGMRWGRDRSSMNPFGERVLLTAPSDAQGRADLRHAPGLGRVPSAGAAPTFGPGFRGQVGATLEGYASHAERVSALAEDAEQDVEVRLWPAARVRGRVVDAHGRPVPGVRVSCRDAERASSPLRVRGAHDDQPSPYGTADAEGRFELGAVPSSRDADTRAELLLLGPQGPRMRERATPAAVVLRAGRTVDLGDVAYAPEEPTRVRRVRVVDPDGAPVWDALVGHAPDNALARSDADGVAEVGWRAARESDPEFVELWATAPGRAATRFRMRLASEAMQTVTLGAGRRIEGRVLDADGRPIAGAWVHAAVAERTLDETWQADAGMPVMQRGQGPAIVGQASSGPDGAFVLEGLPEGAHHLRATIRQPVGPGWKLVYLRLGHVAAGARGVELRMPRPLADVGELQVQLRTETGLLPPQPRVYLAQEAATGVRFLQPQQMPGGLLAFHEIPAGTWTIRFSVLGWLPAERTVQVAAGDDRVETLAVDRGVGLVGRVVLADASASLEGLRVQLHRIDAPPSRPEGGSGHVDAQGRFEATGLRPGTYRVNVAPPAFPGAADTRLGYVAAGNEPFVVPADTSVVRADLRVVPCGVLHALPADPRLGPSPTTEEEQNEAQRAFTADAALEILDAGGRSLLRATDLRDGWGGDAGHVLLAPGVYTVRLVLPGEAPVERRVEVPAGERIELRIGPSR